MFKREIAQIVYGLVIIILSMTISCGDDTNNSSSSKKDAQVTNKYDGQAISSSDATSFSDGGISGDGTVITGDGGQVECYQDPKTHVEIINACTTAQSVDKTPFYPAKAPNGQLPALP